MPTYGETKIEWQTDPNLGRRAVEYVYRGDTVGWVIQRTGEWEAQTDSTPLVTTGPGMGLRPRDFEQERQISEGEMEGVLINPDYTVSTVFTSPTEAEVTTTPRTDTGPKVKPEHVYDFTHSTDLYKPSKEDVPLGVYDITRSSGVPSGKMASTLFSSNVVSGLGSTWSHAGKGFVDIVPHFNLDTGKFKAGFLGSIAESLMPGGVGFEGYGKFAKTVGRAGISSAILFPIAGVKMITQDIKDITSGLGAIGHSASIGIQALAGKPTSQIKLQRASQTLTHASNIGAYVIGAALSMKVMTETAKLSYKATDVGFQKAGSLKQSFKDVIGAMRQEAHWIRGAESEGNLISYLKQRFVSPVKYKIDMYRTAGEHAKMQSIYKNIGKEGILPHVEMPGGYKSNLDIELAMKQVFGDSTTHIAPHQPALDQAYTASGGGRMQLAMETIAQTKTTTSAVTVPKTKLTFSKTLINALTSVAPGAVVASSGVKITKVFPTKPKEKLIPSQKIVQKPIQLEKQTTFTAQRPVYWKLAAPTVAYLTASAVGQALVPQPKTTTRTIERTSTRLILPSYQGIIPGSVKMPKLFGAKSRKRSFGYVPNLRGILSGKTRATVPKPEKVWSPFAIRLPVMGKKKRKKRKKK